MSNHFSSFNQDGWVSGDKKRNITHWILYYHCYCVDYKSLGEISKCRDIEDVIIEIQRRRGLSEETIEKAIIARGKLKAKLESFVAKGSEK